VVNRVRRTTVLPEIRKIWRLSERRACAILSVNRRTVRYYWNPDFVGCHACTAEHDDELECRASEYDSLRLGLGPSSPGHPQSMGRSQCGQTGVRSAARSRLSALAMVAGKCGMMAVVIGSLYLSFD
jgi:hypothetical protein